MYNYRVRPFLASGAGGGTHCPARPPISGGVLPPILGGFGGDTPQKRQKWRSGVILAATANFGASIL